MTSSKLYFKKSIIAGILIGLGVIINVQAKPPVLGALLFSFGLLTIVNLSLPLYTGKIGFLTGPLFKIIIGNLFGIAFIVSLYLLSNKEFLTLLQAAAQTKFEKTFIQMFVAGIFCGILIHFAVKTKVSYLVSMAVILFILIGAEHCIADFPYLLVNLSIPNFLKFLLVILGNSVGAIALERLFYE